MKWAYGEERKKRIWREGLLGEAHEIEQRSRFDIPKSFIAPEKGIP